MRVSNFCGVVMALALVPGMAFAVDFDIRVRGGLVPGIDGLRLDSYDHTSESRIGGNNIQAELVVSPVRKNLQPTITVGGFKRTHTGRVPGVFAGQAATTVQYEASGVNFGYGVRYRTADEFYIEGRLELCIGDGTAYLSTPAYQWNQTREGFYSAGSAIVGGYYVRKTGPLIGLEVGAQTFDGDFDIQKSGSATWNKSSIWGRGGVLVNLVAGIRF